MKPFNEFYRGKRVLVTGHTGFKGAWLAQWLSRLGAEVVGYSTQPPTNPSLFDICKVGGRLHMHVEGDVRDFSRLDQVCQELRPQVVFHLAAQALVRPAFADPRGTFETNVMGTVNVLEAARRVPGMLSCVIVTSDKVYLNVGWEWAYRENDRIGGHEAYSGSKACAEVVASIYQDLGFQSHLTPQSQLPIASARAGNAIGGGDWSKDRIIPDIVRAIANRQELVIRQPQATRPWQHVLEALSGYLQLGWMLAANPEQYRGPWNFGPRDERMLTVAEIVEAVTTRWTSADPPPIRLIPDNSGREKLILGVDCSKSRQRLHWHAAWPVERTLQATVDWYRAFYSGAAMHEYTLQQVDAYTQDAAHQGLPWATGEQSFPAGANQPRGEEYPAVFSMGKV